MALYHHPLIEFYDSHKLPAAIGIAVAGLSSDAIPKDSKILLESHNVVQTMKGLQHVLKEGIEGSEKYLQKMKTSHAAIPNDSMLYSLCALICLPMYYIEQIEKVEITENNKELSLDFWIQVGDRLELESMPTSFSEAESFLLDYEKKHMHYDEINKQVYERGMKTITLDFILKYGDRLLPGFLHTILSSKPMSHFTYLLTKRVIDCLIKEDMKPALGIKQAHPIEKYTILLGLKMLQYAKS